MPKLLALGGPRAGRLVFIPDGDRELTFELTAPFPGDPPLVARYRRETVGDGDVLVHADVPDDADLAELRRRAQEDYRQSGQWPEGA